MIDEITTLQDITVEFMMLSNIPEIEWPKIRLLGLRAYQDLCYDILPNSRLRVKIYLDSNAVIDDNFPDDLVELNAVFVAGTDGLMYPLSKYNRIVPTMSNNDSTRDENKGEGVDVSDPGGLYFSAIGGVNSKGYYVYDEANRRLLFTNIDPYTEVIVDYLSTGINTSGSVDGYYVPSKTIGAIHAYMAYKYNLYEGNNNKALLFKEEFRQEKARLRIMKFNIQDYNDMVLRTITPSILR